MEKKKCPQDKILNPKTGRCVLKNGKIGKMILDKIDDKKHIKKTINKLLKDIYKSMKKLDDKQKDRINDKFLNVPNSALLKMSQVRKLFDLKYKKGLWTKEDYILVIEPQAYDRITKLYPDNFMFSENINTNEYIGYFYNYKNKAVSGSGADFWWIVNISLKNHLKKNLNLIKNV